MKKRNCLALLLLLSLALGGCVMSPPDSLLRSGTEGQRLISASTAGMGPDETPVALYFRYGESAYLGAEPRQVVVQRNETEGKAVVNALVSGPANMALSPLFPPGTEVLSANSEGDILFVTFNEAFLGRYADEPGDASQGDWKAEGPLRRQLCLDSLAATLTEAGLCNQVQVLVEQSAGQEVSMRLQAGFLTRGGDASLLPPLTRQESRLLTQHTTADLLLNGWLTQDWALMADLAVNGPGAESAIDAFSSAGALVEYTLSPGTVAYDGQSALLTADLTLRGVGEDIRVTNYPLRLLRENGLWKMDYAALLAMMNAGAAGGH